MIYSRSQLGLEQVFCVPAQGPNHLAVLPRNSVRAGSDPRAAFSVLGQALGPSHAERQLLCSAVLLAGSALLHGESGGNHLLPS